MSIYGSWKAATISEGTSITSEINLGKSYDFLEVIIPPMDECKLYLRVSELTGGPWYDLGKETTTDLETFDRAASWTLGGFQYLKVVATASQTGTRSIRIRGMRY